MPGACRLGTRRSFRRPGAERFPQAVHSRSELFPVAASDSLPEQKGDGRSQVPRRPPNAPLRWNGRYYVLAADTSRRVLTVPAPSLAGGSVGPNVGEGEAEETQAPALLPRRVHSPGSFQILTNRSASCS